MLPPASTCHVCYHEVQGVGVAACRRQERVAATLVHPVTSLLERARIHVASWHEVRW